MPECGPPVRVREGEPSPDMRTGGPHSGNRPGPAAGPRSRSAISPEREQGQGDGRDSGEWMGVTRSRPERCQAMRHVPCSVLALAAASVGLAPGVARADLDAFLKKPEPAYRWEKRG